MKFYATVDDMWKTIGITLLARGQSLASRVGGTRELLGYQGALQFPRQAWLWNEERRLSSTYGAAELLWYLSGKSDASLIHAYAPSYSNFLDDGIRANGAYGARWCENNQLHNVVTALKKAGSRQCVVTCWRSADLVTAALGASKDLPCTLTLQFLLRNDELHLIVTMRSNDVWLGMPYDIWCFTRLQLMIAGCLDVDVGQYIHQVGSLHVYDKNVERLEASVANSPGTFDPRPSASGFDCVQEMDRMIGRALALEDAFRHGQTQNVDAISNLLGSNTILGDAVLCCASKWMKTQVKDERLT